MNKNDEMMRYLAQLVRNAQAQKNNQPIQNDFDDVVVGGDIEQVMAEAAGEAAAQEPSIFEDEFHEQLDRMGAASRMPDGRELNDIDATIRERMMKREEDAKIAPHVRVNPVTAYGAIQGTQQVVTSGKTSDWNVWWVGEDTEARDCTITLANIGSTGGNTWPQAQAGGEPFSYRPYANIRWGSRAFSAIATVDVNRGCQAVVSGASVYVQLGMDTAPTGYRAGTMTLAAMLSFGTRQSMQPITRTAYIDSLAALGSQNIIVPNFAQQLLAYQRIMIGPGFSAPAANLIFLDTNGRKLYGITLAADEFLTAPIPIASDVYSIDVDNLSATNAVNGRLIFGICV